MNTRAGVILSCAIVFTMLASACGAVEPIREIRGNVQWKGDSCVVGVEGKSVPLGSSLDVVMGGKSSHANISETREEVLGFFLMTELNNEEGCNAPEKVILSLADGSKEELDCESSERSAEEINQIGQKLEFECRAGSGVER